MFVIAQRANQLGNRLFLFAHFIAFAIENNVTLVNPAFEEYAHFFKTTSVDLFCRYPPKKSLLIKNKVTREYVSNFFYRLATSLADGKLKRFRNSHVKVIRAGHETILKQSSQEVCFSNEVFLNTICSNPIDLLQNMVFQLDSEVFKNTISSQQIFLFQGLLFRDFSSFRKHAEKIKEYFKPLDIFQDNVDNLIRKVREESDIVVGVHIRHGDYINFMQGRYFYTVDEYLAVMYKVKNLFIGKKVTFLVCSNTKQDHKKFEKLNCFFGSDHIVEDMYSFAKCDYIIGPPSTYTLWASFYGNVPLYRITDITKAPTLDNFFINGG